MDSTFRTEAGDELPATRVRDAVLHRAAMLGSRLEKRLAALPWSWWQLPPSVRGRRDIAQVAARRGWDAAAFRVLAARWSLLAALLLLVGAVVAGAAGAIGLVVGAAVGVPGIAAAFAGFGRNRRSRRCVKASQAD